MRHVIHCYLHSNVLFANAASFKSHTLPSHFTYLLLLFEYYSRGRCKINFEKNTEAAIKIFFHVQRTVVILIYADKNTSREAAHKSVIAATKLSDYHGITTASAHFLFPSEITCRCRIIVLCRETLLNFLSKWNPDRRSCKVIRTRVERLKFVSNRKYLFGIGWEWG